LYAIGNLDLLRQTALAVVGARDASERGLAISRSIGEQAGRAGIVVVSGGARGIDLMAHTGAIDSGGATICVLSEGILRSNSRADLGVELDRRAALFLSELPPNMTWSIGGAMSRNRIVCALAAVVVVVEAREKGGTVDAADTALELHRPLFVVDYAATGAQNDGNRKLLRKAGARPLPVSGDESSAIGRVDLDPVLRELQSPPGAAPPAGQMDLFA
jgi:DNA processing protein